MQTPSPDIAALIADGGPIAVARFMALANTQYYAARDPLGTEGDFTTAPEISQMFGELIGAWAADLWDRAGRPDAHYVELGPGRGTLARDALRAMAAADLAPPVHLVETSPVLRAAQREALPTANWHSSVDALPKDVPLIIVANEFFDALPIRQFVATVAGWRERMVAHDEVEGLHAVAGPTDVHAEVPIRLRFAHPGSIVEVGAEAQALARKLAGRLKRQGGALITFDYGYAGRAAGDTLQAVHAHAYADPFVRPGDQDLTAHVDFAALAEAGRAGGARVFGPVPQGEWLIAAGISQRAGALTRTAPHRADEIAAAYRRLTDAEEMGQLFKAVAFVGKGWPQPAGF